MKICQYCNREIPDTSVKCRYCKRRTDSLGKGKNNLFRIQKIAALLAVSLVLIGSILIFIRGNSDTAHYINRTDKIRISHPKDWKVFDSSNYYPVFKFLRQKVKSEVSDFRLVCAFSCTKSFKNLSPLIIVAAQPIPDKIIALSPKGLQRFLIEAIREDSNVTEYPVIIEIEGKDFVRYATTSSKWDIEWEYIYYHIIRGNRLYLISLSTRADLADNYKLVLRSMLESLKFL